MLFQMKHLNRGSTAGFSNQQALLALLIVVPISMIGLGVVIILAMRSEFFSTAQAPAPSVETPIVSAPEPLPKPEPSPPEQAAKPKPLANPLRARDAQSGHTCWFQMQRGGRLIGNRCSVTQRVNDNGDRVFDVVEPSGIKRAVVLWERDEVEVFLAGQRYTGSWLIDDDGDVRINLPGGTFAFTPPG